MSFGTFGIFSVKGIHQPAMLHYTNPVRKLTDKVEVMGDEKARCPSLFLQVD